MYVFTRYRARCSVKTVCAVPTAHTTKLGNAGRYRLRPKPAPLALLPVYSSCLPCHHPGRIAADYDRVCVYLYDYMCLCRQAGRTLITPEPRCTAAPSWRRCVVTWAALCTVIRTPAVRPAAPAPTPSTRPDSGLCRMPAQHQTSRI